MPALTVADGKKLARRHGVRNCGRPKLPPAGRSAATTRVRTSVGPPPLAARSNGHATTASPRAEIAATAFRGKLRLRATSTGDTRSRS